MPLFSIEQLTPGRHFYCPGVGSGSVVSVGSGSIRVRWRGGVCERIAPGTQVQPVAPPDATTAPPDATDDTTDDTTPDTTKRPCRKVFGTYAATAVLRWMGLKGWSVDEAVAVFEALTIEISLSTVKIQTTAGKKGKRGAPAPVTKTEIAKLNKLKKEATAALK